MKAAIADPVPAGRLGFAFGLFCSDHLDGQGPHQALRMAERQLTHEMIGFLVDRFPSKGHNELERDEWRS